MSYRFTIKRMFWWVYTLAALAVGSTIAADVWTDALDYRLLANIALLVMAALVTVFAVLYLVRSAWWTNRIGKIYLIQSVLLAVVLDQIVLATWWDPEFPGRQHFRFAIYAMGAAVTLPLLIALLIEQRSDRREASTESVVSVI